MRLTIFVTFISFSAFAQVGLNGKLPSQSGFTRAQLEREVSPPGGSTNAPVGTSTVFYNNSSKNSCFKTACKMAGEFGCDDSSEVAALNKVCRGQNDDECLVTSCAALGQFACDEGREIAEVLVTNCGADETLRPSSQRVQDSGDRQKLNGF